jgi:hypothetical protein
MEGRDSREGKPKTRRLVPKKALEPSRFGNFFRLSEMPLSTEYNKVE